MPDLDGTGPRGLGAFAGRGFGPCGCGERKGFGRGHGRGPGLRYAGPALPKEEERKILEDDLRELDMEKQEIESRLKELG